MLTKNVYNGFRVRCDFNDLHSLLTEYGELINAIAQDIIHDRYAQLIVEDELSIACKEMGYDISSPLKNYKKPTLSVVSSAFFRLTDAEQKIRKNFDLLPDYNFFCKVTFVPYEDGFLLAFDTKQTQYLDLLYGNTEIENFEYWMDRPMPLHLTEEMWQKRGEIWSNAFGTAEAETNGYTRQLYRGLQNIQSNVLLDKLNTKYPLEKRLDMIARNIMYSNIMQEDANKEKLFEEVQHMIELPSNQAELQELRFMSQPFLVESYTPSVLLRK